MLDLLYKDVFSHFYLWFFLVCYFIVGMPAGSGCIFDICPKGSHLNIRVDQRSNRNLMMNLHIT